MPIAEQQKCIFIHIPSTEGTSFTKWLNINPAKETLIGECAIKPSGTDQSVVFQLQHLTYQQIIQFRKNDESIHQYFSFCVVRNPWERVVSDYFNHYQKYFSTFYYYVIAIEPIVTFINAYFTHNMLDNFYVGYSEVIFKLFGDKQWVDPHLLPQYLYLDTGNQNVKIDHIGRFESLNETSQLLSDKLSITAPFIQQSTSKHPPYQEVYDQKTRSIVERIYQKDIELFQYSFD